MNEHDVSESEFEDPGFKAAVRRTIGRETAPPALRAKVTTLLATGVGGVAGHDNAHPDRHAHAHANARPGNGDAVASPSESSAVRAPSSRSRTRDRSFWRTAAIAACAVLALGWMFYQIRETVSPSSPWASAPAGGAVTAVPASLVLDMTKTHDACAKLPDHHKIPGNDPAKLHDTLTAGASVSASTMSLGADWNFKGAGLCDVGDKKAAHLLFVRADEYVSIFSMSAPEECGYGGDSYKDIYEKHVVTGFRKDTALYCVVGSAEKRELGKNDLDPILEKVKASIAMGRLSNETMIATAAATGQRAP